MSALDTKTPADTSAAAPAVPSLPAAPAESRLAGRLDALEGARLYGWAFDPDQPGVRLTVRVRLAGEEIASVVADRARVDLRRNGVGDGAHAFDVELPEAALKRPEAIEVTAHAEGKPPLALPLPKAAERGAEAAIAAPLNRLFEKMDVVVGAQRQLQLAQRDAARSIADMTGRIDAIAAEGGALEKAVRGVETMQREIAERVGDVEVFLVRFDGTLASFDQRIMALQQSGNQHVRPLVLIAAVLAGLVAGAVIALAAV